MEIGGFRCRPRDPKLGPSVRGHGNRVQMQASNQKSLANENGRCQYTNGSGFVIVRILMVRQDRVWTHQSSKWTGLSSSGGFTAARPGVVVRAGRGSHSLFTPLSVRHASSCWSSGRSCIPASRHKGGLARRCRSDGLPIVFALHWPLAGNRLHEGSHSSMKWTRLPNKAGAGNGAMTRSFHLEHLRRAVPDLFRYTL